MSVCTAVLIGPFSSKRRRLKWIGSPPLPRHWPHARAWVCRALAVLINAARSAVVGFVSFAGLANPAQASSDITIPLIATGKLYVIGTTERPHMRVILEGSFQAESDDKGTFQFEVVYHPARCIVGVQIEGKTYEAVVSSCEQQKSSCQPRTSERAEPLPKRTQTASPDQLNSQEATEPLDPARMAAVGLGRPSSTLPVTPTTLPPLPVPAKQRAVPYPPARPKL